MKRTRVDSAMSAVLKQLLLMLLVTRSMAGIVHVSNHGAFPNDQLDDTAAINAAINFAEPGDTVVFDAGNYDLIVPYDSDHHIRVKYKNNLVLQGSVINGKPATRLLRHVSLADRETLPHTIYNGHNTDVVFENFIFDNSPRHTSAGTIVEMDPDGTWVRVQLFDGLPMDAGTGCYAANTWLPTSPPVLKKVRSLTYNDTPALWTIYDDANRIMELNAPGGLGFEDLIEVGEFMSWHYGTQGANQMESWSVDGLTLRNLEIPNIINAWSKIALCNDVTMEDIKFESDNGSLAVGPRDALHISRCTGEMVINNVDIAGVRWDPIVLRSSYGVIASMVDLNNFRIAAATGGQAIPAGSRLGLWDSNGELYWAEVASATWSSTPENGYDIAITAPLPAWAGVGTELKCSAFMPDSVVIKHCDFMNNAGADVILFTDNTTMVSNTHTRSMYPAIYMGSNNSSAGICGSNIQILDSVFTDCGWEIKNNSVVGMVAIDNVNKYQNATVDNLEIRRNNFRGIENGPAIFLRDVHSCTVESNTFVSVSSSVEVDVATATGVSMQASEILIDNDGDDPNYREVSGSFGNSTLQGYDGSSTRFSGTFGAEVNWEFIAPETSAYDVYIYKVVHSSSDDNAEILVDSNGATATHSVDYTDGSSDWHYLGTYNYTAKQSYTVSNRRQGGYLRADAVKFVQSGPGNTNASAAYVVVDFNDMNTGHMRSSNQPDGTGQGFSSNHWESGTSVISVTLGDLYAWTNTQYGIVQSAEGRCVRSTSMHDRRQARTLIPVIGTDTNIWFSFLVRNMEPTDVAGIDFLKSTSYYVASSRYIRLRGQSLEIDGTSTDVSSKSFCGENTLIVGKLVLGNETEPEVLSVWVNPELSTQTVLEAVAPDFQSADLSWNISQLEVLGICSYDTKAESSAGGMLDSIRISNGVDAFDFIKTTAGTLPANEISRIPMELHTPLMTTGAPAPGHRVKAKLPAYAGTDVYHALYLPTDWEVGKKYPVIVEYAGNGPYINKYADVSEGTVEGSNLGYGISGGKGFIWICMPFVSPDGTQNQLNWWGDIDASVEYCKDTVAYICENYGGDSNAVFLAGFSRGAIACNYIGLHDDSISALWKGFIAHSHYDGVKDNWPYPEADRASAAIRLARLGDRPQFISQENSVSATQSYLETAYPDGDFTFQIIPYRNHTDTWALRNSPEREAVRDWLFQVLDVQPPLHLDTAVEGLQLSWPESVNGGYRLQGATNLAPVTAWTDVTNHVLLSNGFFRVALPFVGSNHFFRLIFP